MVTAVRPKMGDGFWNVFRSAAQRGGGEVFNKPTCFCGVLMPGRLCRRKKKENVSLLNK